jgi:hypothetical protein
MQLSSFFNKVSAHRQVQSTHISIYLLLYHYWHLKEDKNHINISRSEIMKKTKILSTATYHKCIRDLQQLGYINYYPSYHPQQGSRVELLDME